MGDTQTTDNATVETVNQTSEGQSEETTTDTQNDTTGAAGGDSAGSPDWQKAAEKYKAQRDKANKQAEEATRRFEELSAKGNIDDVKAELEETRKEAEAKAKQAESDRVNTIRLAKAGCVDIEVALSLLDENGDVDALKEAKPYLFERQVQGSTGFKPSGETNDTNSRLAEARKAAGVKTKEK